jgi:CHAT domain-containing protein
MYSRFWICFAKSHQTEYIILFHTTYLNNYNKSSLPQIKEIDEIAQVFQSSGWSKEDIIFLHGSKAIVCHVSCALNSYSWVHFACHGSQNHILGIKSAFSLHDGPLELSEIASKRLSTRQFAFLTAYHAASGLKDLPGEPWNSICWIFKCYWWGCPNIRKSARKCYSIIKH